MKNCFLLLLVLLAITACKDNPYEEYEGHWSGTYSGTEDNGRWEVNINDEGEVDGTARSDSFPTFPFELTGSVNEAGGVDAGTNIFGQQVDFLGQLNGDNASGTWINLQAGFGGTWEGKRK